MKEVVILNYQKAGNLLSAAKIFSHCGANVKITDEPKEIARANYLVLPGDGAFLDCIESIKQKNFQEPLNEYFNCGRPFLGICVGMQMLLDESSEFGYSKGLGLIPGKVLHISEENKSNKPIKLPHINWSKLVANKKWENTILENIQNPPFVYFMHSYFAQPLDKNCILASTIYEGMSLTAVIQKNNIYGTQFHPEKSGEIGIKIIENFLNL